MPRVKVSIPDVLLQRVADVAEQAGKSIDELYVEAISRYIDATKDATVGSLRSRSGMPLDSPKLSVQLPEELFERADKLAKRLGKKREVLYSEALAKHMAHVSRADSALDQGHDLPTGAWNAKASD